MIVLVGEAPERAIAPDEALAGRIGQRLAKLAGISLRTYLERTRRLNVYEEPPPAWSRSEASVRANHIWRTLRAGDQVILLGSRVAEAFGVAGRQRLAWHPFGFASIALIPHPSGRNRWWNDPLNVLAASRFLTNLFDEGEK